MRTALGEEGEELLRKGWTWPHEETGEAESGEMKGREEGEEEKRWDN
jgi:hypothetical protein